MAASFVALTTDVSTLADLNVGATSTSVNFSVPLTASPGDLLILFCCGDSLGSPSRANPTLSVDRGTWTTTIFSLMTSASGVSDGPYAAAVLSFWDGSTSSFTLTLTTNANGLFHNMSGIMVYHGVTNLFITEDHTQDGPPLGTSDTLTLASETNSFGALSVPLVSFWGYQSDGAQNSTGFTDPTGNTQRVHLNPNPGHIFTEFWIEDEIWTSVSAYPTRSGTFSYPSSKPGLGVLRLYPAPLGQGVPHGTSTGGGDVWGWAN